MDRFEYRRGELHCEALRVADIVAQVDTPAYIYSAGTFRDHYERIRTAFAELDPLICYSVKCNGNIHICRLLAQAGSGFDVVSGGELFRAREAGGDPARMVYAGVGKTDREIGEALDAGLGLFNIESEEELRNLDRLAGERGTVARAALRINPDVDPKTHRYTTTGKRNTKFGVDIAHAERTFQEHRDLAHVRLCGIHIHLGSPIFSADPYVEGIGKVLGLIDRLARRGVRIDTLDLGGGFGASYETDQSPVSADYAQAIVPLLRGKGFRIVLEPGRTIAANAGVLVARVLYTKVSGDKTFAILDAGMNDLIRPTLYDAFHFIWPATVAERFVPPRRQARPDLPGLFAYDVVGPICETGDCFAKDRPLPPVRRGDLLAVFTAGAYGFAMSSQYNSQPRPPEVLVEGDRFRLIRRRETYRDLIEPEQVETP